MNHRFRFAGLAIYSRVCNSHGVCPIASSIRRICKRSETIIDAKSYFACKARLTQEATPPLLRLYFVRFGKSKQGGKPHPAKDSLKNFAKS